MSNELTIRDQFALKVLPYVTKSIWERHAKRYAMPHAQKMLTELVGDGMMDPENTEELDLNTVLTNMFNGMAKAGDHADKIREHMRDQVYPEIAEQSYRLADALMHARSRTDL